MDNSCSNELYYMLLAQKLNENDVLKVVAFRIRNSEISVFEIQLKLEVRGAKKYCNSNFDAK